MAAQKPKDFINKILMQNELSKLVIRLHATNMKEIQKRNGFNFEKNNYHLLSPYEKYILNVFQWHNRYTNVISQIWHCREFMASMPRKEKLVKGGIRQFEFYQYHTEVMFHKIATTRELKFHLINQVYNFGLKPEEVNFQKIESLIGKKASEISNLARFKDSFQELLSSRNSNTHRGVYKDHEQDKILLETGLGIYELSEMLGEPVDNEFTQDFPKFLVDFRLRLYRKDRLKFVENILMVVCQYGAEFLDILAVQFLKKCIEYEAEK